MLTTGHVVTPDDVMVTPRIAIATGTGFELLL